MCRSSIRILVPFVMAAGLLFLTGCEATTRESEIVAHRLGDTRIDENGQAWRLIDDMSLDDRYPERRWVRIQSIDPQ